jgi:DnaK suppressor protein
VTDFDPIKQRLDERLVQLRRRTSKIEAHLREPGDADWQEQATQRENDEVLEQLDASEVAEMAQIRRALDRIEAGTYGQCERCSEAIDPKRLAAVPVTGVCIACAD